MPFRVADAGDLPRIVEIYNAAVPGRLATADTEPVTVESRHAWFEEHAPGRRPLLVLEEAGAIAGWVSLQSFYGRPAYRATAEVSAYVAPERQRQGIGRRLVAEAIRLAPTVGVETLLGFVFAHNVPSLRLFEGAGFQRWGHLPGVAVLDGVYRDLCILGRKT
jgi:L-amino acid N-acyltransferase YncA